MTEPTALLWDPALNEIRHKVKLRTTSWKWANKRDDFGRL
jgi:hypothetical protein